MPTVVVRMGAAIGSVRIPNVNFNGVSHRSLRHVSILIELPPRKCLRKQDFKSEQDITYFASDAFLGVNSLSIILVSFPMVRTQKDTSVKPSCLTTLALE